MRTSFSVSITSTKELSKDEIHALADDIATTLHEKGEYGGLGVEVEAVQVQHWSMKEPIEIKI